MGLIQYAGVNGYISGLFGELLSHQQYGELLSQRSVEHVVEYLREQTSYGKVLPKGEEELHRGQIEHILKQQLVRDHIRIIRFLNGNSRNFFRRMFIRFEVENLKLILRTVLVEHDDEKLKSQLIDIGQYSAVDFGRLSQMNSMEEVARFLQGTRYGNIITRFMESYREEQSLFPVEMALDAHNFVSLWKGAYYLNRKDQSRIYTLLGTLSDFLNIQWIYRVKKFYRVEPSVMLGYTLPIRYRLSLESLRGLIQTPDLPGFRERLKSTPYGRLFQDSDIEEDILFDRDQLRLLLSLAEMLKREGMSDIGRVLGYIQMREIEMRDIVTILEGVRYGMDENRIKRYITHRLD